MDRHLRQMKRNLSWPAPLLIAAAVIVMHLLLLFLFKPVIQNPAEYRPISHGTVICREQELAGDDIHNLNYYLKYLKPESVVKPGDRYGFSSVRRMLRKEFKRPEVSMPDFSASSAKRSSAMSATYTRDLAELDAPVPVPIVKPEEKQSAAADVRTEYPVWEDMKGNLHRGLLFPDNASLRLLRRNHAAGATLLRITPSKKSGMPPEIRILRSSGSRTLDLLAERQLALRAAETGVCEEILLSVTWNRPKTGKENK